MIIMQITSHLVSPWRSKWQREDAMTDSPWRRVTTFSRLVSLCETRRAHKQIDSEQNGSSTAEEHHSAEQLHGFGLQLTAVTAHCWEQCCAFRHFDYFVILSILHSVCRIRNPYPINQDPGNNITGKMRKCHQTTYATELIPLDENLKQNLRTVNLRKLFVDSYSRMHCKLGYSAHVIKALVYHWPKITSYELRQFQN